MSEMIAVRLTLEQKERLEQIASQRSLTVSDVIRNWIDADSGILSDLMERIKAEAQRREASESYVIERALHYAFEHLFVHEGSRWVRW